MEELPLEIQKYIFEIYRHKHFFFKNMKCLDPNCFIGENKNCLLKSANLVYCYKKYLKLN